MAKSKIKDKITKFGYRELTEEEQVFLPMLYREGPATDCVRMGSKGYCMPRSYLNYASDIYNMDMKEGDIFVASYQRSDTNKTQELVWLIANDLDYEKAAKIPLNPRYIFLEQTMIFDGIMQNLETINPFIRDERALMTRNYMTAPVIETLRALPPPRFVKTHLPLTLLPPKLLNTAKVVYVARDPRDVIVSCYNHARDAEFLQFRGSLKRLLEAFRKDLFKVTPYFEHVKEAWALRQHPNMLFLFYEDLLKDPLGVVKQVADFFKKELTPEQSERLCEHLGLKSAEENLKKGKCGGWRQHFDEEMSEAAERWIKYNLRASDLRFPEYGASEAVTK